MQTNEKYLEWKLPTAELGQHVLMTVMYIKANGFPKVNIVKHPKKTTEFSSRK